jgi:diacylglycerol kinase family enzyme
MDAGSANGRIFLLMAGCGFDAHVVAEAHRLRQQVGVGRYSYWTYVKPILNAIRSYQYPEIRVYWDNAVADPESEATGTGTVRWVFACNLPLYGWGLPLAREADATDGVLDVRAFRHGSLWHGLRYLAAAQFGWQRRLPDCVVARATTLQVTAEQPVPYQLDGDPGGWLPLDIEVLAKRLTLVVPRGLRVHA